MSKGTRVALELAKSALEASEPRRLYGMTGGKFIAAKISHKEAWEAVVDALKEQPATASGAFDEAATWKAAIARIKTFCDVDSRFKRTESAKLIADICMEARDKVLAAQRGTGAREEMR